MLRGRFRVEILALVAVGGTLLNITGCSSSVRPIDGTLMVSLVVLLTRPEIVVSGQVVQVKGYLSLDSMSPTLYLSSEHAIAFDSMSAIRVADPTDDGGLSRSDCFGRFVIVRGTYIRRSSGETSIQDPIEIVDLTPVDSEKPDWANYLSKCWQNPILRDL